MNNGASCWELWEWWGEERGKDGGIYSNEWTFSRPPPSACLLTTEKKSLSGVLYQILFCDEAKCIFLIVVNNWCVKVRSPC